MPRPFSETDRERVRRRLLDAAREHFSRYGYRKASVADVARAAGIGKGTVYLFARSKAELFALVAAEAEQELRARLVEELRGPWTSGRELLRRFFRLQMEALDGHPLLWVIVDPLEAGAIFRELPPDAADALRRDDEAFFAGLVAGWRAEGLVEDVDPRVLTGLARALYAVGLHRDLVGEDVFGAVADVMVEGATRVLAAPDPS